MVSITRSGKDCSVLVETTAREVRPGHVIVRNELPAGTELFADPPDRHGVSQPGGQMPVRHGGKITTVRFSAEERNSHHILVLRGRWSWYLPEEKEKTLRARVREEYRAGSVPCTRSLAINRHHDP